MATSSKRPFPENHPLLDDEPRLEAILDLMWAKIHKTMFKGRPVRPRRGKAPALALVTGATAREVLDEALEGLLYFQPERLEKTWEGLAVTIAHNKAVAAIQEATKGRVRPGEEERDAVSLDRVAEASDDSAARPALIDTLASDSDPEAEAEELAQQLGYRRTAERILTPRDREIYFRIHYRGETKVALSEEYNLTPQRIGQIYVTAAKDILAASRADLKFPRVIDPDEGGTR